MFSNFWPLTLFWPGFQNYINGQERADLPYQLKLSKICSNQCKTKIFFFTFLESLGKFRNCHRAILTNLLYSWLNFNVLGLVGQICPSLVMIGLRNKKIKKWIHQSLSHRKPEGHPMLTQDFISEK